jgi:gas vesicle protein GvpL/GvpF
MSDTAVYVYCLVKSARKPSLSRVPPGLPGASKAVAAPLGGSVWCIVAEVPLETYGPGRLEAALGDMNWVGEVALAHESVVEHFAAQRGATVVPMKLFTMFSSADRAVAEMRSRRGEIRSAMSRISGCEEWGVRVLRPAPAAQTGQRARTDATSGAAFLAAKKRAREEAAESVRAAAEAALDAYDALAAFARDARRRDDVPDNATTPPLLDAAFLVPTKGRTRFRTAARRAAKTCADAGAQLIVSGPWPAYNFIQSQGTRG